MTSSLSTSSAPLEVPFKPLKPFEQMTPADYEEIGFMCGLEVHQQLKTGHKLFCRCPGGEYSPEYDAVILRHMRPTLSELGEYDGTALMEKKTKKNIFYRIHRDTVCTYEFDDTPPFLMDDHALDIAIEISLLFNLNIVSEVHIGRKQYLDGSIPTGFQRTAIIGVTGHFPAIGRNIGVRQLSIEEDSCREVSDVGHDRVYLTDRLGMPLIEVVTEPDMKTPQESADVCRVIGNMLRSTHHVRRGYGATRQDVNVSVRGGTRVEIKGVPQIGRIPRLTYNEARRQCSLLNIRAVLHHRGVTPEAFTWSQADVTPLVLQTDFEPVRAATEVGHRVRCVRLEGFAGLLREPTQEHTSFAKEFSDRVRVIACIPGRPNIAHTDSANETLRPSEWQAIREKLKAVPDRDALMIVWGPDADLDCAAEEIANRALEATIGIPSDTRQALRDDTVGFERVLPGPERMYPDTDLPPITVTEDRLTRIAGGLPRPYLEREERYRSLGLAEDIVKELTLSRFGNAFDRVLDEIKIDPRFPAVMLSQRMKALRRAGHDVSLISVDEAFAIFSLLAEGTLTKEAVPILLEQLAETANPPEVPRYHDRPKIGITADESQREAEASAAASVARQRIISLAHDLKLIVEPDAPVDDALQSAVQSVEPGEFSSAEVRHRYLMGWLMDRLRGQVEGALLSERLSQSLGHQSSIGSSSPKTGAAKSSVTAGGRGASPSPAAS
ncbi:MAG: Glu-tRNA(Gln) amidotransferase subunit GatE [Planctomycetota bacterium]